MRPSQIAQLERIERLADFKKRMDENPRISLDELGNPYGISRERVRQILKENHIGKTHAKHPSNGICANGHNKFLHKNMFFISKRRDSTYHKASKTQRKPEKQYWSRYHGVRCFYCKPLPKSQVISNGYVRARYVDIPCTYCGTLVNKQYRRSSIGHMGSGDNRYKGHDFCNRDHFYKWMSEVHKWWRYSPIYQRMLVRRANGEHFTVGSIIDEYQQAMAPSTFQKFKRVLNSIKSPFIAGLL